MVRDSPASACTAEPGMRQSPLLWGNRSLVLISKIHFFPDKERNRNHPFSLDSKQKAFRMMKRWRFFHTAGCARLLLVSASVTSSYLPCGQVSRRPGGITQCVHSPHGLKYLQCRFHLSMFHGIPILEDFLAKELVFCLFHCYQFLSQKKKSKITSFPSLSWEEQPAHPELGLPCPGKS